MMKKTMAVFCTALMAVGSLGFAPASAAQLQLNGAQVMDAQFSFGFSSGNDRFDRRDRNDRNRGRFERRGDNYFYNGHRGQRERRAGWRQYNGFWFPPAAFSFGITINPNRGRGSLSAQHRAWCDDRYISYRASDNTFQPYNGPRQQCVSPYSR